MAAVTALTHDPCFYLLILSNIDTAAAWDVDTANPAFNFFC